MQPHIGSTIPTLDTKWNSFYGYAGKSKLSRERSLQTVPRDELITSLFTHPGRTSIADALAYSESPIAPGFRRDVQQGRCGHYDFVNDHTLISDDVAFDITNNMTVMFWAKNDDAAVASDEYAFCKYDLTADKREWAMNFKNVSTVGFFSILFGDPADGTFEGEWRVDSAQSINVWRHYAFSFASGTVQLYIDGLPVAGSLASGAIPATLHNADADVTIGSRLDSTVAAGLYDGQMFDNRIYSSVLTDAEVLDIYTTKAAHPTNLVVMYKADEQAGTLAFDSAGGNIHGTYTGITVGTFHATQDIWSFQDRLGWTDGGSGVFVPRDESDITKDVLGATLQFPGKNPMDVPLENSNCITADGVNDELVFTSLAGGTTIVSSEGTSTPTIDTGNNKITLTAGTIFNLLLSDGKHIKGGEGAGVMAYDSAGGGDHATLTGFSLAAAWGATQDDFHTNITDGCSRLAYFNGTAGNVTVTQVDLTGVFDMTFKAKKDSESGAKGFFGGVDSTNKIFMSPSTDTISVRIANTTISFTNALVLGVLSTVQITRDGDDLVELFVNGVSKGTGTAAGTFSFTDLALDETSGNIWFGLLFDFVISDGGTVIHTWDGHGNEDEDWKDLTGSNDGTAANSPGKIYIPVDQSNTSLDATGGTLINPAGTWHNGAETTLDFLNLAGGSDAPPIIVQSTVTPNTAWNLSDIALIKSGTLTINLYYQVIQGTVDGHTIGEIFQSDGTETPDSSNYVILIDQSFFFRIYLTSDEPVKVDRMLFYDSLLTGADLDSLGRFTTPIHS